MTLQALPAITKIIISIIWDVLDLTIGRIPAFGTLFDLVGTLLALLLWGVPGLAAFGEVFIDPTDQLDAEIPTLTLIGLFSMALGWSK